MEIQPIYIYWNNLNYDLTTVHNDYTTHTVSAGNAQTSTTTVTGQTNVILTGSISNGYHYLNDLTVTNNGTSTTTSININNGQGNAWWGHKS